VLLLSGLQSEHKQKFGEINAERINIIEPNGIINVYDKSQAIQKMKAGPEKDAAMKRLAEEWGAERVFVACRCQGKPRIKISVKDDGTSSLVFLDESGKPIYTLPPK